MPESTTCKDARGTTPWMGDDCTDAGGRATQGAVAEVELRREQQSRAPTVGALRLHGCRTTARMQEVEQRREQLPR
ncbi:MAG TPA: hypothetical protein VIF86_05115 [Methylobacter sp.]